MQDAVVSLMGIGGGPRPIGATYQGAHLFEWRGFEHGLSLLWIQVRELVLWPLLLLVELVWELRSHLVLEAIERILSVSMLLKVLELGPELLTILAFRSYNGICQGAYE